MVRHVETVIAVLDSSKLGASALTSFCPATRITRLITAGPDAAAKSTVFQEVFPVTIA
jgi:DeoR/GlpR family transcriptional regulator of sugar metabolism